MVLDVKINQAVCLMEALVMYQGTGSSSGTERQLANLLAIKQHMTFMHVMITKDAFVTSTVLVLLIVLKPKVHLNHQLHLLLPRLLLLMIATMKKIVVMMMSLLFHRQIPGKHGRH